MKIGFDAKRLFYNNTGLGNYSRTLVNNLLNFEPELKMELFAPQGTSSFLQEYKNKSNVTILPKPLGNLRRTLGFTKEIHRSKINIYHGLSNELPLNMNRLKSVKKVVTMHDLIYRTFPKDFTAIDRTIYHYKSKRACQMADVIIAISEATKRDLIEILGVEESKIEVLYQSCHPIFQNNESVDLPVDFLPSEYMLYVGTINKRKNLKGIIEAMSLLPVDEIIPLVVVGKGNAKYMEELRLQIREKGLSELIYFVGGVKNEELKAYYQHAKCTILPSFYEGFGIPIIESLFCGTPVITSDVTSLPEAAGNCGLLVDPQSIEEIADAITKMTQDSLAYEQLTENISAHVDLFSSERTTKKLMDCYRRLL